MANGKIKTAVITGGHPYDVVGLQSMLCNIPEIEAYPQNMWEFVLDPACDPRNYEVLLFYNMHLRTPAEGGPWEDYQIWIKDQSAADAAMKETLEGLGEGDQGIFLLHHALVAFPGWQPWEELSGMRERGSVPTAFDQTVHIGISDTEHPITATLEPFYIVDETYMIDAADEDSHILLTTDHPQSMKTIAWTRTFGKARVFCYQSGHDNQTWANPGFRAVVGRGIQWLAGRQTTIINSGGKP
tara:strand:- start:3246 stop:3971 length:726 start_codon:yes stop_codon:yes gene_type:complete